MFDVITIGSATKDVFLISKDFRVIKSTKFSTGYGECFTYGSKIELKDIYEETGGGATNVAFSLSRLGVRTSVISRVGDDYNGDHVIAQLRALKINTRNIIIDKDAKTAYSTILLTAKGERTILVYRGASQEFTAKDIKNVYKTKYFYLTSLGGNEALLKRIFAVAKKNNIKIIWNPGIGELELGLSKLQKYINKAELLIVNKEEAGNLVKKSTISSIIDSFTKFKSKWTISDGAKGVYAKLDDEVLFAPAQKVKVMNTTGAGDAFGAGVAAGMVKRLKSEAVVKLGVLNATGVIQEMGAKRGVLNKMPKKKEFEKVKIKKFK